MKELQYYEVVTGFISESDYKIKTDNAVMFYDFVTSSTSFILEKEVLDVKMSFGLPIEWKEKYGITIKKVHIRRKKPRKSVKVSMSDEEEILRWYAKQGDPEAIKKVKELKKRRVKSYREFVIRSNLDLSIKPIV